MGCAVRGFQLGKWGYPHSWKAFFHGKSESEKNEMRTGENMKKLSLSILSWLVVWTFLKNMSSSIGMMTFPIYMEKKIGNQTTNQWWSNPACRKLRLKPTILMTEKSLKNLWHHQSRMSEQLATRNLMVILGQPETELLNIIAPYFWAKPYSLFRAYCNHSGLHIQGQNRSPMFCCSRRIRTFPARGVPPVIHL